jgi:carbon monoxide dehydrogenase subunit G
MSGTRRIAVRIEATARFATEPQRVWDVLVDWERQAAWMPDVAWIRPLGPARELGARMEVRTKVLGVPLATDTIDVVAWDPPHRLGVEHRGVVVGAGEWLLEKHPHGGTVLTWTEEIRLPPPVAGDVALWAYGPIHRWMVRRSLRNLGRLLEGSTPVG